ncbi:hypothetical protein JCM8202_003520 [Rhodotorula sphaerocarpa]
MGALLSRPREADYDSYLEKIQTKIAARQARLQQIRLRERRANALFITYGLGLWILYSVLWWFGIVGAAEESSWETQALRTAPVVLGPVAIICTRMVSRFYFRTRQEKEEATLKHLVKQKQDKVEEIKKKTGYYSTRDLLEKYDEALRKGPGGSAPSTPAKLQAGKTPAPGGASPGTPARPGAPTAPSTPQNQLRAAPGSAAGTPADPAVLAAQGGPAGPAGMTAFPPTGPPPTPHTRSIMDKVADALLGVSPEESNPYNKYALICAKCFSHNGLCPKEEFDFVQYRCPRCGFFNPRRRDPPAAAAGALGPSPSLPSLDTTRHRRVHSEFAPSPLGAVGPAFPREMEEISPSREEDRSPSGEAPVALENSEQIAGQVGSSAVAGSKTDATRRRSRKPAQPAEEEQEPDAMDMDE